MDDNRKFKHTNTLNMEINFEQFIEKYKPLKNHLDDNASYDGLMFETYGEELEFVRKQDNNKIWTIVEGENNNTWFLPNYHFVNRIGYFICEIHWENEDITVNDNEMITNNFLLCFGHFKP